MNSVPILKPIGKVAVPKLPIPSKFSVTGVPTAAKEMKSSAGMLNVEEVIPVSPVEVKLIVAPVTAEALVAVRPVNEAWPTTAAMFAVPPRVHIPASTAAVTVAVLAVVLPYWSWMEITGWAAKTAPFVAGAVGWVVTPSFVAVPARIAWETVALE